MDPVTAIANAVNSIAKTWGLIGSARAQRLAQDDINTGLLIRSQEEQARIRTQQQNIILFILALIVLAMVTTYFLKKNN